MVNVSLHKQTLLNYINDKYGIHLTNSRSLYWRKTCDKKVLKMN